MQKNKRAVRAAGLKILRVVIQVLFFLFLPSAYSAAFAGFKTIFTLMGSGAALQWSSLLSVFIVLLAYTALFGRFFCGYACAFGSLGDWLYLIHAGIAKKRKKKMKKIPVSVSKKLELVKYVVLVMIMLAVFTGTYSKVQGSSPWDVFSMLYSRRLPTGRYLTGLVILILIMAGMFFEERFFCRFLCPMGAIFSLVPTIPLFTLRRDRSSCIRGCHRCETVCPCSIELPDDGSADVRGECFMCNECSYGCPKQNIHCVCRAIKGSEWWFTLIRAGLLAFLLIKVGI